MKKKTQEKERARALRKQGFSINEICKIVPASKGSISVWVRDIKLTEDRRNILKNRKSNKDAIINLLNLNYTYTEIEQTLGCTRERITYYARSIGYKYDERQYSRLHVDWKEVQAYYDSGKGWRQCAKDFGISPTTFYKAVKLGKIRTYPRNELQRKSLGRRADILERRSDIERWIAEEQPKAFICRELNCKPTTLESYLEKMGIVYLGNQGSRHKTSPLQKRAEEYLHPNISVSTNILKYKLIQEGLKDYRCEICHLDVWQGQPIPLELHHINGHRYDNRLENLLVICPNCHAQTPNFAGKNARKNT